MRLLVHNLLMCNVSKCDKPTNYPLEIHVQKSVIIDVEYKRDAIIKLIPKLDFSALALTVHSVVLTIMLLSWAFRISLKSYRSSIRMTSSS